jgi:hypothetical protein
MSGIPGHEVKLLLGHSGIFGGATDEYIEMIREMIRPEHRTYLSNSLAPGAGRRA